MSWLITQLTRVSTKGATSTTSSDDDTTSTQERGARSVTTSNTATTTEDAGGTVSFTIRIKDGLNASGANPAVCPTP